jgi:hypothetical protein
MVKADFWVEGKADQKFLADLLKIWFGLTFHPKTYNFRDEVRKIDIRIQDLGGKSTFLTEKISSLLIQNKDQGVQNIVILDADDIVTQRTHLDEVKAKLGLEFPFFLLPDNNSNGELENLLEQIINPLNQPIFNCWADYEACIGKFDNPTRPGFKYTIPAKKSKIYSYLEVLVGETDSEKELAKDPKRDFTNIGHWQIDRTKEPLKSLHDFLKQHLGI